MAQQKLSPRQKMINMMYLVLIAMLALNVSREILKSFHLFELSYINANLNTDKRNNELFNAIKLMAQDPKSKERAKEWYSRAVETRKLSKEFCTYVESMKLEIEQLGGGREELETKGELTELKRPDEMEVNARYFQTEGKDQGSKLQKRINETREKLLSQLKGTRNDENSIATLRTTTQLKAIDPKSNSIEKKTWVNTYLVEAPLAGVMTLLSKSQNDCKQLESDILSILGENVNINTIIHDGQMALIKPQSQNVLSGEYFEAEVALMTYDTKVQSVMKINGRNIEVKDGIGRLRIPAFGTNSQQLIAEIETMDPNTGKAITIKSEPLVWNSYEGSAAISAENMNVLFFGLENPIMISVPGITPENTIVSSTNGISLRKLGAGKYMATVSGNAREGKVLVSARMSDGKIKSMGEMKFRLRTVPKPKIKLGSLESGTYDKATVLMQQFLFAALEDFYFQGVGYKISGYSAHLVSKKASQDVSVTGNSTDKMKSMISGAKSGDLLYINDIKVSGPNGPVKVGDFSIMIK